MAPGGAVLGAEVRAGDQVVRELVAVLDRLDAEEDRAEEHRGDQEEDDQSCAFADLRRVTASAIVKLLQIRTAC